MTDVNFEIATAKKVAPKIKRPESKTAKNSRKKLGHVNTLSIREDLDAEQIYNSLHIFEKSFHSFANY